MWTCEDLVPLAGRQPEAPVGIILTLQARLEQLGKLLKGSGAQLAKASQNSDVRLKTLNTSRAR